MKELITGIIYKYTSPSGKSYIGQTRYESKRISNHRRSTYKLNTSFGRAIRKYGYDNFEYEVIFKAHFNSKLELIDILNYMEVFFIKKYDTINSGYNIMIGGGITEMPEETRLKISNTLKGKNFSDERKRNISIGRKGIPVSQETRDKISESKKGIAPTDQCRAALVLSRNIAISQYSKDGVFIKDWESAASIERELKINAGNIAAVCRGNRHSAGKFI